MTEKRRPILQIYGLYGENIASSKALEEREAKFLEGVRKERARLQAWLQQRGMIPLKTKDRR
jgi:hypothetical protein